MACSLSSQELNARLDRWTALSERYLIEAGRTDDCAVRRYRAEGGVGEELRELIRLEGECCPFLRFDLIRGEGEIRLEVRGPAEAAEMIDSFATA